MDPQPGMKSQQAALARASQLTAELMELVRTLRAAVGDGEEKPAPETRASGRLKSGELRAAMNQATRRSKRQVPHLLG